MGLPSFSLVDSHGKPYSFSDYNDQVILIVNTASQCGFAPQFQGLEDLYQEFKDQGFIVIGFPSNQFKQEPLEDEEMASACQMNFGVTFPLNMKVQVNGPEAEPLFQWLKGEKSGIINSDIKWNFTKFLINRQGQVVKRYPPTTSPEKIRKDIVELV